MIEFISLLAPLLIQFATYRQASEKFAEDGQHKLKAFDRYCKNHYPYECELTQEMVDSYYKKRATENNESCRGRCFIVSAFIRYLQVRGLTEVSVPQIPKKMKRTYVPHAFTHEELSRFFHACDCLPRPPKRSDMLIRSITIPVIFRLIYSTGMRTVEARLLRRDCIDLVNGHISIVNTKGYNQHYIVLHNSIIGLLRVFDETMNQLQPGREFFFSSAKGTHYCREWLTGNFRSIWRSVNSTQATAYDLRHNYAIENINSWIDEGFDFYKKLAYLSKSMGHMSIESTKYYYSLVPHLNTIIETRTKESFDWIIPEVTYEENNH